MSWKIFNLITPAISSNKYLFWGVLLFLLGIILTPFIIGVPVALVGWILMTFGFFYHYFKMFPGSKKVSNYLSGYFSSAIHFFKSILKEAFKR